MSKARFSTHNMAVLMQEDVRAFLLFQRLCMELKENPSEKDPLNVIMVNVPSKDLYQMFDKNSVRPLIKKLIDGAYIVKVSSSQKDSRYYINPNMIHTMSLKQAESFTEKHIDLFPAFRKPDQE
jgi:hypothetical protein